VLDDLVERINRALPEAPYPTRASFVEVAPWLALLSAILGLLLGGRGWLLIQLLPGLLAGYLPSPFFLVAVLSPVMALVSIPGLRERKRWGWSLFTLSVLIDLILSLLRLDVFGILFGAVFFYLLLQTYTEYGRRYWR
jgi:hypothetical protein